MTRMISTAISATSTLKKIGHKEWNKRMKKIIAMLPQVLFYDHLYLGGGNSRRVKFKLPEQCFHRFQ